MSIKKEKSTDYGITLEDIKRAGLDFGHRISKCHPKMKPYVVGVKGSDHISIIDLEKTKDCFIKTLDYLKDFIKQKKTILFIGTKLPIRKLVQEIAQETKMPYAVNRWLGGTLTNFSIIQKRIKHFKELEEKKKSGELNKYTKKEQLEFDRELDRLEQKFGGIKNLEQLPDAIFVIDMKKDELSIKEAKQKGIIIIGIADTEVDPTKADYFIPANDDAISSVKYILEKVKKVILENKTNK
jgi:small subunit ribosomal protein S2